MWQPACTISLTHSRARGADDGGRRRRDASYGVAPTAIRFQQFGDWENSAACSLSDISGWRAGILYPFAGGGRQSGAAHLDLLGPPGRRCGCCRRRGFLFSDIPVRGDAGARAIGATDDAAAVELPGRRRRQPGSKAALTGSAACSLSDISGWRAGILYPFAGGGRQSGAAHLDLLGPPGRRCGCCRRRGFLFSDIPVRGDAGARAIGATDDAAAVELPGRRRRQPGSKAALTGSAACSLSDISGWRLVFFIPLGEGGGGCADVADFFLVILVGGWARGSERPRCGCGVRVEARQPGSKAALTGSAACSPNIRISGWRAGILYPFAGGGRQSGAAQKGKQGDC